MRLTARGAGIGLGALALLGMANAARVRAPRTTTTTTTTAPAPPARVVIERLDPSAFAARVEAAAAAQPCQPPARATAWAEIAADGTLLGVHASCATDGSSP